MILKNFLNLLKASAFQFIIISLLISFLFFLLNLLFGVSFGLSNFAQDVRERLWIYFYIDDSEDDHTSEVISLVDKLEDYWMEAEYLSSDESMAVLEERLPEIMWDFEERYGVENPLPSTLHVVFESQQEYEYMQEIITGYDHLIENTDDAVQWQSFQQQQERISNIINITNFVVIVSYFLVAVLLVIIVSFLLFFIKSSFYNFYDQIEIEKLLGAFYWQIKSGFVLNIVFILILGFLLMLIYFRLLMEYLQTHHKEIFDMYLLQYLSEYIGTSWMELLYFFSVQFVIILMISLYFSNIFLSSLIKKL